MAGHVELQVGDCAEVFAELSGLQSLVMDPPAGIRFMGVAFDRDHGGRKAWIQKIAALLEIGRRACERGAYSLTWALPRTSHWTMSALDDAGWEVCDVITHHFGNGWPKNAKTALKPASEHWILCRNGAGGALNIDECRVPRGAAYTDSVWHVNCTKRTANLSASGDNYPRQPKTASSAGSWPTNTLLSHHPLCEEQGSREVATTDSLIQSTASIGYGGSSKLTTRNTYGTDGREEVRAFACLAGCSSCGAETAQPSGGRALSCANCATQMHWCCPVAQIDEQSGNNGGASRFFPNFYYSAKAPPKERHAGCSHMLWAKDKRCDLGWRRIAKLEFDSLPEHARACGNIHPTVKNLNLCRWLVRLVTPKGGTVGDMFCGSGSILIGAAQESRNAIGCDLSTDAIDIAYARSEYWAHALAA